MRTVFACRCAYALEAAGLCGFEWMYEYMCLSASSTYCSLFLVQKTKDSVPNAG